MDSDFYEIVKILMMRKYKVFLITTNPCYINHAHVIFTARGPYIDSYLPFYLFVCFQFISAFFISELQKFGFRVTLVLTDFMLSLCFFAAEKLFSDK